MPVFILSFRRSLCNVLLRLRRFLLFPLFESHFIPPLQLERWNGFQASKFPKPKALIRKHHLGIQDLAL